MAEFQITRWREIPSMVSAREGESLVKISLSTRFQEAIDEAAMRLGDVGADAYLDGWLRDPWIVRAGSAQEVVTMIAAEIEKEFSEEKLKEILDTLGGK